MADKKNIFQKLGELQHELKAPKNLTNKFGNYKYRSAEGILEAAKPLLFKFGLLLIISDEIIEVGGRIYVKSTVRLRDTDSVDVIKASANAREADIQKGMSEAQITGASSSYARKYALNGLFAIDDVKDADSEAPPKESKAKQKELSLKQYEAVLDAANTADEKGIVGIRKKIEGYPESKYRTLALKGISNRESHLSKQPTNK